VPAPAPTRIVSFVSIPRFSAFLIARGAYSLGKLMETVQIIGQLCGRQESLAQP
jgi:hypothetical protein